jgi:hypothetical protein
MEVVMGEPIEYSNPLCLLTQPNWTRTMLQAGDTLKIELPLGRQVRLLFARGEVALLLGAAYNIDFFFDLDVGTERLNLVNLIRIIVGLSGLSVTVDFDRLLQNKTITLTLEKIKE